MITRCLPRLFSIWYCQGSSLLVRVTSLLECSMVLCIWTMWGREGQGHLQICLGTTGNNICAHLEMFINFFLCVELPETIDKQVEIVHKRLKQLTRGWNNWQEVETGDKQVEPIDKRLKQQQEQIMVSCALCARCTGNHDLFLLRLKQLTSRLLWKAATRGRARARLDLSVRSPFPLFDHQRIFSTSGERYISAFSLNFNG